MVKVGGPVEHSVESTNVALCKELRSAASPILLGITNSSVRPRSPQRTHAPSTLYPGRGFWDFPCLDTYPSGRQARPAPGLSRPILWHRPSQLGCGHINKWLAQMRQMRPNQVVSMQVLDGALSKLATHGAGMDDPIGPLQCSPCSLPCHGMSQ